MIVLCRKNIIFFLVHKYDISVKFHHYFFFLQRVSRPARRLHRLVPPSPAPQRWHSPPHTRRRYGLRAYFRERSQDSNAQHFGLVYSLVVLVKSSSRDDVGPQRQRLMYCIVDGVFLRPCTGSLTPTWRRRSCTISSLAAAEKARLGKKIRELLAAADRFGFDGLSFLCAKALYQASLCMESITAPPQVPVPSNIGEWVWVVQKNSPIDSSINFFSTPSVPFYFST